MISYRDATFCIADTCEKREKCTRYFSKELAKKAEKLNMPLSFALKFDCFEPEAKKGEESPNKQ